MQSTPRLSIDMRSHYGIGHHTLLGNELVSQIVAAKGEKESGFWADAGRIVLLSLLGQTFAGQLKRHDTTVKIERSIFSWFWERHFAKTSDIALLHRFRKLSEPLDCFGISTVTTLLPSGQSAWFHPSQKALHSQTWVVPSENDKTEFCAKYALNANSVQVVRPSIRRAFFHVRPKSEEGSPVIVLLFRSQKDEKKYKGLDHILLQRFGKFRQVRKYLDQWDISIHDWMSILKHAKICFYLTDLMFDDGLLALESLYCNVPTVFLDNHRLLREIAPKSSLRYNRFLMDNLGIDALIDETRDIRIALERSLYFQPLGLAGHYNRLYEKFNNQTATKLGRGSDVTCISANAIPTCCGD